MEQSDGSEVMEEGEVREGENLDEGDIQGEVKGVKVR